MAPRIRLSPQTLSVLESFLSSSTSWRYGYDISRETELKSGTLYPILMRLHDNKLLETKWEPSEEQGRPPRHMYRLTAAGVKFARESVSERKPRRVPAKPALNQGSAR